MKAHLNITSTPRIASLFNGFAFRCFEHALGAPVRHASFFLLKHKNGIGPPRNEASGSGAQRKQLSYRTRSFKRTCTRNTGRAQQSLQPESLLICMFGKKTIHDQSILTVFTWMRLDEESLYERIILMNLHKTYPAMSLNSSKTRSRRAEL